VDDYAVKARSYRSLSAFSDDGIYLRLEDICEYFRTNLLDHYLKSSYGYAFRLSPKKTAVSSA
jgi:hypothetical protein